MAGIVEILLSVTLTVPLSPLKTPQAPPTDVTFTLVANGKATVVPLTFVMVATGAVLSIVTTLLPDEPILPALSD